MSSLRCTSGREVEGFAGGRGEERLDVDVDI